MDGERVLAVGDMVADLLLPVLGDLPAADSQLLLEDIAVSPGGNTLNFALAAGAQGADVELIAACGNDTFSSFLKDRMAKCAVKDVTRVIEGVGTAVTVAIPGPDGSRRLLTYPGANAFFRVTPDELRLYGARHLHTGGYWFQKCMMGEPVMSILKRCRELGVMTSMDPATAPGGWGGADADGLRSMLHLIDILFLNADELKGLAGIEDEDMAADALLKLGVGTIVLHRGALGASLIRSGQRMDRRALPVGRPLNPTGCGDVLNGSFIAALTRGEPIERALSLGVASASLHLASREPRYPSLDEAVSILDRSDHENIEIMRG